MIHPLVKHVNLDLRQAAYEYFQSAGSAGVADCLFSLADLLATYEERMDPFRWSAGVAMSCNLLDMWVNHYQEVIDPITFMNGEEIKKTFHLKEGPIIGKLLADQKFAQATGKLQSKGDARLFIQTRLDSIKGKQDEIG